VKVKVSTCDRSSEGRLSQNDRLPIEIDVADVRFSNRKFWLAHADLFAQLEELHPGDPGEVSGAELRVSEKGEYAWLTANIGKGDVPASHCMGYLEGARLGTFLAGCLALVTGIGTHPARTEETELLNELYPEAYPSRPSGAMLVCDGRTLKLCFGSHCFGVLYGAKLRSFLERALARATHGLRPESGRPARLESEGKNGRAVNIGEAA